MRSVVHITYATTEFRRSARQLSESAKTYGIDTRVFTPKSDAVRTLARQQPEIMAAKRGAGYWLWKPYLLLDALNAAPDGTIVFYTDAGVTIVADPEPLFSLADEHEIVLFHQVGVALAAWTKRDAFLLTGSDSAEYWAAPILTATFQVYRAGTVAREFVRQWFDYCCDPRILTDMPNTCGLNNFSEFRDHRHDQSVLSLMAKRTGLETFIDPSQFGVRPSDYPYGQIFDHHRTRNIPFAGIRSQLQIGTRLRRALGR